MTDPRDPTRIDRILKLLEQRWKEAPDQRLGQLVTNYLCALENAALCDPYHVDDDFAEASLARGQPLASSLPTLPPLKSLPPSGTGMRPYVQAAAVGITTGLVTACLLIRFLDPYVQQQCVRGRQPIVDTSEGDRLLCDESGHWILTRDGVEDWGER